MPLYCQCHKGVPMKECNFTDSLLNSRLPPSNFRVCLRRQAGHRPCHLNMRPRCPVLRQALLSYNKQQCAALLDRQTHYLTTERRSGRAPAKELTPLYCHTCDAISHVPPVALGYHDTRSTWKSGRL